MGRRQGALALLVFVLLAAALLHEGFRPGSVLISGEAQRGWLPWSAKLPPEPPHNRFVVDQPQVFYPYLIEAQRIYRGQVDALWSSRGGGGLPFFGNISSSLLHPLTLMGAVLPIGLLPLAQGLAILALSATFTWLFLRRLGVSVPAASMAAVGFGFGGHQVFWMQYALAHVLVALPFTFWAAERVVERSSARRLVVLALGFVLLVLGGHPETTFVSSFVAATWIAYRLRGGRGLLLALGAGLLALGLAAVQWMPFLEYVLQSRGLYLRNLSHIQQLAALPLAVAIGCAAACAVALLVLRRASSRGVAGCLAAGAAVGAAVLLARNFGLTASSAAVALPELYGNPLGGGSFTGAQDFPGLNSAWVGVLPVLLALLGLAAGLTRGPSTFFVSVALLLWGTAFHLPGVEGLVRALPGLSQVQPTRFLGPAGFALACGAALVLDRLCSADRPADLRRRVAGGAAALALAALACLGVSALAGSALTGSGDEADGASEAGPRVAVIETEQRYGLDDFVTVEIPLPEPADVLRVRVGRQPFFDGPPGLAPGETLKRLRFGTRRIEEGRHRLVVEAERGGQVQLIADQPFVVRRARQLSPRDAGALAVSLALLAWIVLARRPGPVAAWLAAACVAADVLGLAAGYNTATPTERLYPRTETVDFLRAQTPPFRILTEGTTLLPDTQFAVGVDHLMSYDNIGYQSNFRLLHQVPFDTDTFWGFRSSRATVDYASPLFDLLDVRFVVTDTTQDLSDIPGFELAHESETRIWRNTRNLGRAFLVPRAVDGTVATLDELRALDLRAAAVLEQAAPAPLGGRGRAEVQEHTGSHLRVSTDADGPALLVLAENWTPGWTASVDGGEPVATVRADVSWQAVPVPAGAHEVRFAYSPASFRWGLAFSLAALLAAAAMLCSGRPLR